MPDLQQPSLKQLAAAATSLDSWMERVNNKHEEHLASAYTVLTQKVQTLLEKLDTSRGRLVSTRANLSQAQALHTQLSRVLTRTMDQWIVKDLAPDLGRVSTRSARFLEAITGVPQRFGGVDAVWIEQLQQLNLAPFQALGEKAVDDVARAMYEHLMGGSRFRDLTRTVKNVLIGVPEMTGRSVTATAQQMSFDAVRNFQGQVTNYKAEQIGLTSFIYYGDVIRDSRPFCAAHAGEVMTEARIAELDQQDWRGKSGPLKIYRGGYRCRHFFLPVKPEWTDGQETAVANYFTEE